MNRRIYILLLLITLIAVPAFAQEVKQKVAVYVTGSADSSYKKVIGAKLVTGLTMSSEYSAVERTSDFLAELEREQNYQLSGAVDDGQIVRLGKQFGVRYVLIADVGYVFELMFISARLIDVETAMILRSAEACQEVVDAGDLIEISDAAVSGILGGQVSASPMSASSVSPGMRSDSGSDFTETVSGVSFDMVHVEGGTFEMGSPSGGEDDERPLHRVTLDGYWIGRHEVTQKLWVAVMGSNPSWFKGDDLPVGNVSWHDVQKFIVRLNSLTGKKYRLPTEAEWEYAARGGSKSMAYEYSGSDYLDKVGWFRSNSGYELHPVGTKLPNELGIYDMSGNVYEWCYDWRGGYSFFSQTNPQGSCYGDSKVLRGGSLYSPMSCCRSTYRNGGMLSYLASDIGFRLAL